MLPIACYPQKVHREVIPPQLECNSEVHRLFLERVLEEAMMRGRVSESLLGYLLALLQKGKCRVMSIITLSKIFLTLNYPTQTQITTLLSIYYPPSLNYLEQYHLIERINKTQIYWFMSLVDSITLIHSHSPQHGVQSVQYMVNSLLVHAEGDTEHTCPLDLKEVLGKILQALEEKPCLLVPRLIKKIQHLAYFLVLQPTFSKEVKRIQSFVFKESTLCQLILQQLSSHLVKNCEKDKQQLNSTISVTVLKILQNRKWDKQESISLIRLIQNTGDVLGYSNHDAIDAASQFLNQCKDKISSDDSF